MSSTTITNLSEKYRPETLADIRGQASAVSQLRSFLAAPSSAAFVFEGGTGTGKTSAALAFARELGVDVANEGFGGLYVVPSGEQTAGTIRDLVAALGHWPMTGSGWRVAIVNEADLVSQAAAFTWLDVLENLPPRTVVVFTTNNPEKLSERFRDRCETVVFESSALVLTNEARAFVAEVWAAEVGTGGAPTLETLGAIADGCISFRRLLARLNPLVRAARAAAPVVAAEPAPAPAGEVLERTYKGTTYRVQAVADGFEWNGTTYRSLRAVALAITGASTISGTEFFRTARRAA
jgi:hypothetical protein